MYDWHTACASYTERPMYDWHTALNYYVVCQSYNEAVSPAKVKTTYVKFDNVSQKSLKAFSSVVFTEFYIILTLAKV